MQPSRSAGGPPSTASRRAAASSSVAAAAPAAQDRSSFIRDMGCCSAPVDGPPATAPLQDAVLLGIDAIARRRTSIGPPREVVHLDELDDRFADDEDSHFDGSPGRRRVFAEIMVGNPYLVGPCTPSTLNLC
ncbi:hypothetical protein MAPG_08836 [Magnaporthiopsis poae ATCC 64411]|uniref:Uncharacterized protein n=1 Tax=Magnaporthiopsis poae (strain ATCC 64411 / 73-15) TaxID=644358 RepID=A0A0C4E8D5_MAGP6|nr:hypothetical protein MAPG_08836 [Magnaporthiopsis poae ATCC 64411]